jgi:hypothetical protein
MQCQRRFRLQVFDVLQPLGLTTVFRREDEEWRIVDRYADPIAGTRLSESILQT